MRKNTTKQFERTDKIRVIREVACDYLNQIFVLFAFVFDAVTIRRSPKSIFNLQFSIFNRAKPKNNLQSGEARNIIRKAIALRSR